MFHLISDLNLDLNEKAEDQNVINSKSCDYIIIAGNVSNEIKRSMFYAENLARLYPDSKIIYNFGLNELVGKRYQSVEDGIDIKINRFRNCPDNLFYPKGQIIDNHDFLCSIGWPRFRSEDDFKKTFLPEWCVIDYTEKLYIGDIKVSDTYWRCFNQEFINQKIEEENNKIQNWLNNDQGFQKILITSTGPNYTKFFNNAEYTVLDNLDLKDIIWIHGGDKQYLEKLSLCYPGRDRSNEIDLDLLKI